MDDSFENSLVYLVEIRQNQIKLLEHQAYEIYKIEGFSDKCRAKVAEIAPLKMLLEHTLEEYEDQVDIDL